MFAPELIDLLLSDHVTSNEHLLPKIESAIEYAEKYQHKSTGFYHMHHIPPKTQEAISLLVEYLAGTITDDSIWNNIHSLLRFNVR